MFFLYQDYDFLNKESNKLFDFIDYRKTIDITEIDSNLSNLNQKTPSFVNLNESTTKKSIKNVTNVLGSAHKKLPNQFVLQNNANKTNLNLLTIDNNLTLSSFKINSLVLNSYVSVKAPQTFFNTKHKNIFFHNDQFLKNYSSLFYINSYKLLKSSSSIISGKNVKDTNSSVENEFV
jgi:hypothetical protein